MLSKNQLGFLYMFMSVCAFSLMDIIVKWSVDYPIGQVLFFRGFFGILFYFFIIPKERLHNFYYTKRAGLHFLRCMSGLVALVAIFIALRKLPLATVVSISFAAPIFTTILSIFLLSEKVGIYRWLAVIIGFIGILIINEPGISQLICFPSNILSWFILCSHYFKTIINNRTCMVNFFLFFFIYYFIKFFKYSTRMGYAKFERFYIFIFCWYFWWSSQSMAGSVI